MSNKSPEIKAILNATEQRIQDCKKKHGDTHSSRKFERFERSQMLYRINRLVNSTNYQLKYNAKNGCLVA